MNSLVEIKSDDGGKTWKKFRETPIQEQPFNQVTPIGSLGEIPRSLLLERNGSLIVRLGDRKATYLVFTMIY